MKLEYELVESLPRYPKVRVGPVTKSAVAACYKSEKKKKFWNEKIIGANLIKPHLVLLLDEM